MKRRDSEKSGLERQPIPNGQSASCHPEVFLRLAPVFVVGDNGNERQVARAVYCPADTWNGRHTEECNRVVRVIPDRRAWPHGFEIDRIAAMLRGGPGCFLSWGYHIAFYRGAWTSLQDPSLEYLPPPGGELTRDAAAIVRFRDKHPDIFKMLRGGGMKEEGFESSSAILGEDVSFV